jgi:hypothetical protein
VDEQNKQTTMAFCHAATIDMMFAVSSFKNVMIDINPWQLCNSKINSKTLTRQMT